MFFRTNSLNLERCNRSSERESNSSGYGGRMVEAAQHSFNAARQRYRKRRSSRGSSTGNGYNGGLNNGLDGAGPSAPPRRISSKYSGRELLLDDEQCEQLSEAFFHIPDKYYLFEQMFLKLFEDDPDVAIVFNLKDIPTAELRRRTPFRTHVCKFQRFMTTVLDLLTKKGREEELIQIVRMVGRQHCNVKQLSFTASRWLSFKNALMFTFAKHETIRHLRSNSLPHVHETYKLEFHLKTPTQTNLPDLETVSLKAPSPSPSTQNL